VKEKLNDSKRRMDICGYGAWSCRAASSATPFEDKAWNTRLPWSPATWANAWLRLTVPTRSLVRCGTILLRPVWIPPGRRRRRRRSRSADALTDSLRRLVQLPQVRIALLAATCISIQLCLRYLVPTAIDVSEIPLYVAVAARGLPLLWRLGRRLIQLEFGSDLLAAVSIVAAAITGEYLVGAIIVLMLSGGVRWNRMPPSGPTRFWLPFISGRLQSHIGEPIPGISIFL
jgi:hypothetical protein